MREHRFSSDGPIALSVTTMSGDIVVTAGDGDEVLVRLTSSSDRAEELLAQALVDYDESRRELVVRSTRPGAGVTRFGLVDWLRHGLSGGSDVDVVVTVPAGSSVKISTASGDTALVGPVATVTVNSASGDISARGAVDSLAVNTASGDIFAEDVTTALKVNSASGDTTVASAATETSVQTASGDCDVTVGRAGHVSVKGVSGDVRVRVARGLIVDVNASSVTGELTSSIDLGGEAEGGDGDEVALKIATISGDVRVERA